MANNEPLLISAGANLVGSDLYKKLSGYFVTHFKLMIEVCCSIPRVNLAELTLSQKSETLQDVDLLRYYATEWDRYTTGANYLNRLFTYLNRYWVKRERDEGKKAVYQVYTVSYQSCRCIPLFSAVNTYFSLLLPNGKTSFSCVYSKRTRNWPTLYYVLSRSSVTAR